MCVSVCLCVCVSVFDVLSVSVYNMMLLFIDWHIYMQCNMHTPNVHCELTEHINCFCLRIFDYLSTHAQDKTKAVIQSQTQDS